MGSRKIIGPANILKRGFAFLVDLLLIDFFLLAPFRFLLGELFPITEKVSVVLATESIRSGVAFIGGTMALLALSYFMLCEYIVGQTPGKMMFKLNIVTEGELTLWKCFVRSLYLFPLFPFFFLSVIDPIVLVISKTDQRLSEYLSKTRVVEVFNG